MFAYLFSLNLSAKLLIRIIEKSYLIPVSSPVSQVVKVAKAIVCILH